MKADQPATIPVALAGVLTTGVALLALVVGLDPVVQGAIIAFGNSVIVTGTVIWLNQRTTSSTSPVVEQGTEVSMVGSADTVTVNPTPPGPVGVEGGAEGAH